ncbi:putative involucrin repeat protein [Rhypophila decipiens]
MNGFGARQGDGYGPGKLAPAQPIGPNGKILMEGYKKEVLGGFENERPRYNQMNGDKPQASPHVDLDDPIQVHLLTETALSDSRKYQILSQEEVDGIKKQVQSLTMRIEQARANLAIQSKYRDAAISMAKLYSPGRPETKRRSFIGNNRLSDQAKEAEMERQISEKRCEELATELFSLEKCLMEPQRKLLEHTCAILQLTHRASSKKSGQPPAGQLMTNGIPGSPESLYTYSNARNSLEPPGDDGFDDRSLYLALDQMDGPQARPRKNTIEIPMKSPVREQNQLRGEMDRVKEENVQLSSLSDEQRRIISDTERKLETLNTRLRDVVITFNPTENAEFPEPSPSSGSGDSLNRQIEYLEMGLAAASEEQKYFAQENSKDSEYKAKADEAISARVEAEERIQELNRQVYELLLQSNTDAPTPDATASLDNKLDYLGNALQVIQIELETAADLSESATAKKQNSDQVETVLTGLWDIIQSGFAEIQQQKVARKQNRANMGLPPDEDDMSGDESVDPNETYSLQAFSAKVQWLYAQATSLKEQKSVLKRQIKQQRELNNKSDAEKDQEVKTKSEELEKLKLLLDDSELAAKDARDKLAEALNNLDALQKASEENDSTSARAVQEQTRLAQDQLKERSAKVAALEAESKDREMTIAALESTLTALESQSKAQDVTITQLEGSLKESSGRMEAVEANLAAIQAKLNEADEAKATAEAKAEELAKSLKEKEEELEQMNVMVIELKTELTFAKAELDGAYGSRAQRAAEVAALSKSSETQGLNQQVANLKAELTSTLRDFEEMTKESIAAEKEKLDLESQLDDALSVKQGLEAEVKTLRDRLDREVSRLKEELDKEKLRVPPSPGPGSLGPGGVGASRAGASMLSEQFRATMKEERKKFQEELREEQAKRRKLEDEIRALKKATPGAGIGRSPLGPLSPASR